MSESSASLKYGSFPIAKKASQLASLASLVRKQPSVSKRGEETETEKKKY
jgi:hypothetical protein